MSCYNLADTASYYCGSMTPERSNNSFIAYMKNNSYLFSRSWTTLGMRREKLLLKIVPNIQTSYTSNQFSSLQIGTAMPVTQKGFIIIPFEFENKEVPLRQPLPQNCYAVDARMLLQSLLS